MISLDPRPARSDRGPPKSLAGRSRRTPPTPVCTQPPSSRRDWLPRASKLSPPRHARVSEHLADLEGWSLSGSTCFGGHMDSNQGSRGTGLKVPPPQFPPRRRSILRRSTSSIRSLNFSASSILVPNFRRFRSRANSARRHSSACLASSFRLPNRRELSNSAATTRGVLACRTMSLKTSTQSSHARLV